MTRNTKRVALAALTAAILAAGSVPAFAQAERLPVPVIAIIDGDMVANESLAGKGIVLEQAKYAETLKSFVTENEGKLRTEEQDLTKQRAVLAPDVFEQKVRDFQKKANDLQTQVKSRSDQIAVATQFAQRELTNNIVLVGQEVAKERGANIAINRTQALFFEPGFDVSKQVLAKLNQKITSIKFPDPSTLQIQYNEQGQIVDVSVAGQNAAGAKPAAPPAKK
jgi:Skp family chaperone for outer membrane proteins